MFPTLADKATWNYDEMTGVRVEMHPSWRAIVDLYPELTHVQPWKPGAVKTEGAAWDWQIALSMAVRNVADDVTRTQMGQKHRFHEITRGDGSTKVEMFSSPWYRFELPPVLIPVDNIDEGALPLNPAIDPKEMLGYYARTHSQGPIFADLLTTLERFEGVQSAMSRAMGESNNGAH